MKEYKILDLKQQVKILDDRGIKSYDIERDSNKLEFINYYKLKELAYPFAVKTEDDNAEIKYENLTFNDLINRYYQDKNLRREMFHCIEKIETAFKTKLGYTLGNKLGPYGYLRFSNWMDKKKYCKYYINDKQSDFIDRIKDNVENGRYKSICISQHYKDNEEMKKYKIPIWMLVEQLTFGEALWLFDFMDINLKEKIADSFNCKPNELESWLKTLKFIRNQCAHNFKIIDLKLKTKPKLMEKWKNYLYLDENSNPTGGLAEVILVMVYLTIQVNEKYLFNRIQNSIDSIVNKKESNSIRLGFKDIESSSNAIAENGGYIKNKVKKNNIRKISNQFKMRTETV